MARKILESCPTCGGELEITEVRCTRCETQVRARYRPCDFCALSEEQSTFLRIFLTSRGNLSEVEKRLGVSYPTVRAKLDEVIARIEARPPVEPIPQAPAHETPVLVPPAPEVPVPEAPAPQRAERRAILDAISRGEISAVEGLEKIRELGGGS